MGWGGPCISHKLPGDASPTLEEGLEDDMKRSGVSNHGESVAVSAGG